SLSFVMAFVSLTTRLHPFFPHTTTSKICFLSLHDALPISGIDLEQVCVKLSDLDLLPREIAQRHLILPVLSRGERLFVAMANPKGKKVIDELEFVPGERVYPSVTLERPLSATIGQAHSRKARGDDYVIGPRGP